MKIDALRKELAAGQVRPAYLLAGEEPLLRDDAFGLIRAAVLSEGAEDFNFERLDGAKVSPGALRDSLRALPVMAPRRLVLLREPEPTRGAGKELPQALPDLLADVAEQSETVLVVSAAKVDKRSRWVKRFGEPAALVECDPPRGVKAIASFVKHEARGQGVKLEDGVAERFAEHVGPQLLLLRQEIAKAALLAGLDEPISLAHVEAGVTQVADDPIWDLTDAIGEGRRANALQLLGRMMGGGAPPVMVLGSLASHFRKLSRVRGGVSVGGPPFAVRKLENQARRFTSTRLVSCLDAIHDTDLALKGAGALQPGLALERLVLGLAS